MSPRTIRADAVITGMRLVIGFCGTTMRVTRAYRCSAGMDPVILLEDGSKRYYRAHAQVEVL